MQASPSPLPGSAPKPLCVILASVSALLLALAAARTRPVGSWSELRSPPPTATVRRRYLRPPRGTVSVSGDPLTRDLPELGPAVTSNRIYFCSLLLSFSP